RSDPSPKTGLGLDTDAQALEPACANLRRTGRPCRTGMSTSPRSAESSVAGRIMGIFARDQIDKMRGDRQREFVSREQNAAAFFLAKVEVFFELSEGRDPVFELPFPIVPEFGRNSAVAGPKARCVRDEFLPIPFFRRKSDHC